MTLLAFQWTAVNLARRMGSRLSTKLTRSLEKEKLGIRELQMNIPRGKIRQSDLAKRLKLGNTCQTLVIFGRWQPTENLRSTYIGR